MPKEFAGVPLVPTVTEYNRANRNALVEAGLSPQEVLVAVRAAKIEQLRAGIRGSHQFPYIPKKINPIKD